mmetsp:Transcript_21264/g.67749  ORF Transcript_21264/g.67749 Transcript_21264/m.67749 type:complete len:140 (+) Transcript_21264:1-420(+)
MLVHTTYCILAVAVYSDNLGYPRTGSKYAFDAGCYLLFELLPSVVVMLLTHQKGSASANSSRSTVQGFGGASVTASAAARDYFHETTEAYPPFASTPVISGDGESLTARLLRADHAMERHAHGDADHDTSASTGAGALA